jgi:hypothetical protein
MDEDFREEIPNVGVADSNQSPAAVSASASIWTLPNKFGITRRYYSPPTSIPDGERLIVELIDDHVEEARVATETETFMATEAASIQDPTNLGASSSSEESSQTAVLEKLLWQSWSCPLALREHRGDEPTPPTHFPAPLRGAVGWHGRISEGLFHDKHHGQLSERTRRAAQPSQS